MTPFSHPNDQGVARRRALAGAAALAAAIAGAGSGVLEPPAKTVLYLGGEPEGDDRGWAFYRRALARRAQAQPPAPRLRFAHVAEAPPAAMSQAVAQAFEAAANVVIAPTGSMAAVAMPLRANRALLFSTYFDPVRGGIAASLRHAAPGVTGISLDDKLDAKRAELLRDAFPAVRRIGVLVDSFTGTPAQLEPLVTSPMHKLGFEPRLFYADTPADVDALMNAPVARTVDGWVVPATYVAYLAEQQIIDHLQRLRLPAIHATVMEVTRGALMAYEPDQSFVWDTLADLTLRVLAGEDPGSIPVQRPRRLVLAVRPRDEPRALRIDPAVVRRADRVF